MRHRKSGRRLGRTWEHRKAMYRNMARSLLTYGRIRTTVAKAKELRKVADKLIALALRNDLHTRRQAYKILGNHALVKKLFDEYGPLFVGIKGGFTRVVKLGLPRPGDNAPLAVIEFIRIPGEEAGEAPADKAPAAKAAAAAAPAAAAVDVEEEVEEDVVEDEEEESPEEDDSDDDDDDDESEEDDDDDDDGDDDDKEEKA